MTPKRWFALAAGGSAVIVVAVAIVMTRATPVTAPEAEEIFRADKAAAAGGTHATDLGATEAAGMASGPRPAVASARLGRTAARRKPPAQPAAHPRPAAVDAVAAPGAENEAVQPRSDPQAPTPLDRPLVRVPAEGVYAYATDGGESFSGYEFRTFPKTTYRTIVHQNEGGWADHHVFLRERQSWGSYRWDARRRLVPWVRNLVVFGPMVIDETIRFDPPLVSSRLPWRVGRAWEGTFDGETYGSYRVRTGEHTTVTVEGAEVEVWMDELDLEMHGSLEGTVLVKRWISPATGVTVREEYDADVDQGPFTYNARWSVTVRSLTPTS